MIPLLLLVVGFVPLIGGGTLLVEGAAALAKRANLSPVLVGLTLVAFGTSAPELIVGSLASIKNQGEVVFGNVIGSNVLNLALILGLSAVIRKLPVHWRTTWREIPLAVLAAVAVFFVAVGNSVEGNVEVVSRSEGGLLLLFFAVFLAYTASLMQSEPEAVASTDANFRPIIAVAAAVSGIILLVVGGQMIVTNAVIAARRFGVPEYVIAATIVAIGTSLPELTTSVVAAIRGNTDIAVGNVIGSNIFNSFLILGTASVIRPVEVPAGIDVDLGTNFLVAAMTFVFVFTGKGRAIQRWEGLLFLLVYVTYTVYLLTS